MATPTFDFPTLYYRACNSLYSNVAADFNPATRVLGTDVTSGYGTVFTALGTRFDIAYVAQEAFLATDSYEADTRAVDGAPVSEGMRFVRAEIIKDGNVPERYKAFVDAALAGTGPFEAQEAYAAGDADASVVFLTSPAAPAPGAAQDFLTLAERAGVAAYATNAAGDAGAMRIALGQTDELVDVAQSLAQLLQPYEVVVTDDAYVYDALHILVPEATDKLQFIDQFIAQHADALGVSSIAGSIAYHQSGVIERLYPGQAVAPAALFPQANVALPARHGFDVTDSGLAGGLGLAHPEEQKQIAAQRVASLAALGQDVIVSACANEAVGLNAAQAQEVQTLLHYVAQGA